MAEGRGLAVILTVGRLPRKTVDSIEAFRSALQRLTSRDAQAYFHTQGAIVTSQALQIIEAARVKRLPSMFHETNLATSGGLAAYGRVAVYRSDR